MSILQKRQKISVPPYSVLARIYDRVMSHVNYRHWAEYVEQLINYHGQVAGTIYDFSCGSGTLCSHLAARGWRVAGCDASIDMIKIAANKYYDKEFGRRFFSADIRFPPIGKKLDIVVSLYDSMNYLLNEADFRKTLDSVYEVIRPGGLLIFDISTIHNSLTDFANFYQRENYSEASFVRKSKYDKKKQIQENYFEIALKNDREHVFCEKHLQRMYPIARLKEFIRDSKFEMLASYRDFTFRPDIQKCERVHFVLKR